MAYFYKIVLHLPNTEPFTIGPVHQTENIIHDDKRQLVFYDEFQNVITIFNQELIQSLIREDVINKEPIKTSQPQQIEKDVKDDDIEISNELPPSIPKPEPKLKVTIQNQDKEKEEKYRQESKQLPPVRDNVPIEGAVKPYQSERPAYVALNNETKSYEVHTNKAKREVELAQNEVAASAPPVNPLVEPDGLTRTVYVGQDEKQKQMTYKGITVDILYNTKTKKVMIPENSLIYKYDQDSLRNSKHHQPTLRKRKNIIKFNTEPFNATHVILTEDKMCANLTQALSILTGSILNPSQYWKDVNMK